MKMTHDEMIAVIAAHRKGFEIEYRYPGNAQWIRAIAHLNQTPNFNFHKFEYRIAHPPPPKPREFWQGSDDGVNWFDCAGNPCDDCRHSRYISVNKATTRLP